MQVEIVLYTVKANFQPILMSCNYLHDTVQGYEPGTLAQDTPIFRNTADFEAGRAGRYDTGSVYDSVFSSKNWGDKILCIAQPHSDD